jgi:uncharacterized membrane protein
MVHLVPIPTWQAMHPLIVHFPIALLFVAPLFVIIGAFLASEKGRGFLLTALILMTLGTAGTFVARASGEAATKVVAQTPQIKSVLENHEELAETSSILFTLLTVIFAAIVLGPRLLKWKENRTVTTALPLAFLLFYGAGAVLLMNTAHNGGRLVHELGVKSPMTPQAQAASAAPVNADHDD